MAEPGSMMYMKADIGMETIFGDGSEPKDNSILGKMFSAEPPNKPTPIFRVNSMPMDTPLAAHKNES